MGGQIATMGERKRERRENRQGRRVIGQMDGLIFVSPVESLRFVNGQSFL